MSVTWLRPGAGRGRRKRWAASIRTMEGRSVVIILDARVRVFSALTLVMLLGAVALAEVPADLLDQEWFPKAPPLPPPAGRRVIRVSTVDELYEAAEKIKPGGTILIEDGHYMMPRYFALHTDNVTMRSASGQRDRVVIDGARSRHNELVAVSRCRRVTIADLTIQNIEANGFKINSDTGVHEVTIYNCVIHNIWERGVKGVPGPVVEGKRIPPRNCRVQYCLFYNDRPKRLSDDSAEAENPERFGGNYVGGIDIMTAKEWVISDNVFIGIRGRTGAGRGAIFIWNGSEDCIVERNIIIDCDSGICLGNSHRSRWPIHCTRCIVRSNFVTRCPENDILADYTRDCRIYNNSVHDPESRLQRLIRVVHDNDGLLVVNNLFSGPGIRVEMVEGEIDLRNNVIKDLADRFVDPLKGNLHLTATAREVIDRAEPLKEVAEDLDGEPRGEKPDIGADEFVEKVGRPE